MTTVYLVKRNTDLCEGRGIMGIVAAFTNEDDAWSFAETLDGVMGHHPPEGWRAFHERNKYGEVAVEPLVVLDALAEHASFQRRQLVESAKKKLTPDELTALRETRNF